MDLLTLGLMFLGFWFGLLILTGIINLFCSWMWNEPCAEELWHILMLGWLFSIISDGGGKRRKNKQKK